MEYFDFIKPGDLDNLPEDPQLAFSEFVKFAQARLVARLEKLDDNQEQDWHLILEAKHGFQNVVVGAARTFRIEPFGSADVPEVQNYSDNEYRQFRADLSHYITQIMLASASFDRSNSVPLLDKARQSLRTYIYHLREAIDRTDLPEKKKKRLHKRVDDLEAELSRSRIRFVVFAGALMAIAAAPGELNESFNAVLRITNLIMRELGEAKAADDEQRRISADPAVALLPPRKEQPKQIRLDRTDLDEEIPF